MHTGGHILDSFNDSLTEFKSTTLMMGSAALRNLDNSIRGLIERDKTLCNQAIAADDDEDLLELEVDRQGMAIMLKYRPVASDLRLVIATMKISSNFESASDLAVSIAKRSRKIIKGQEIPRVTAIEPLYELVSTMLKNAVTAYSDLDLNQAIALINQEEEVHKMHKKISRKFSREVENECPEYREYLNILFICRWLERIGELAIDIAEEVVFAASSEDIRHSDDIPSSVLEAAANQTNQA
ncbi:phosphate signaling complex protein PhoU [Persicirhabdus sediminis]|uniref:Phosphate-specific transport system accessory protein PhoU n=1 Tax=Persicirhabdus sediminis TaxID=454144 RepID=A0A8J7SKM3_9BACT|nr:phosphate signaling complex protein PhoU [Persicirhabdus sediminis]MBK1791816.1 phosphate signaling complex protein PhoU [Persicirhabdus sediminis]